MEGLNYIWDFMDKESNKQFIFRNINRKLVNYYCSRQHKLEIKSDEVFISVIMLSFNRVEDTIFSLKALYKYTKLPFEVILFDNNSDADQISILKEYTQKQKNLKLIESEENLGCARGRIEAVKHAKGNHYLFIDNDIVVTPYYLENLLKTLNSDKKTVAVCSKVIFPDLTIQFNGGKLVENDEFLVFDLLDSFKYFWDKSAVGNPQICPWIPGGATLWKVDKYREFPIDEGMQGSFEDNEVSIRIGESGYNMRNCPSSVCIHYHMNFKDLQFRDREIKYIKGRYNEERTAYALRHFWRVHKKIFVFDSEEATYGFLKDYCKENILKFLKSKN